MQTDGASCGIFVAEAARRIVQDEGLLFSQADVATLRLSMALSLLTGELHDAGTLLVKEVSKAGFTGATDCLDADLVVTHHIFLFPHRLAISLNAGQPVRRAATRSEL